MGCTVIEKHKKSVWDFYVFIFISQYRRTIVFYESYNGSITIAKITRMRGEYSGEIRSTFGCNLLT